MNVIWGSKFHPEFVAEFKALPWEVRKELAASVRYLVENGGPQLGSPQVDTLIGSKHANLKELRFYVDDGVWRVAFAFDPKRNAIILVAGNKASVSEKRFYKDLIRLADMRYSDHLAQKQTEA